MRSLIRLVVIRGRDCRVAALSLPDLRLAIDGFARDLIAATRALVRARAFTAMTLLMLTIGIGASAAAFSVIDAVLLAPLPFRDADRIVYINGSGLRSDNYRQYEGAIPSLAGVAIHGLSDVAISGGTHPRRVQAMPVSGEFFEILGIHAAVGRVLGPDDDAPAATPVVVTSHALAVREFGAAEAAVGGTLTVDERPFAVVGVLPAGFSYRRYPQAEVWLPLAHSSDRGRSVLGRLRDGADVRMVHAEAAVLTQRIAQVESGEPGQVSVLTLPDAIVAFSRRGLYVLVAMVGVTLLVACANVANLCLVRNVARTREFSVRRALGATRTQLVCHVLAEGAVLSVIAAALGVIVAAWATQLLLALQPAPLPGADRVAIGARTAMFTIAAAAFSTIVFAVSPGLAASARPPNSRTPWSEHGGWARHAQHGAMVLQIALSTGLLVSTALLFRTYLVLFPAEPGFEWRDRLAFRMELPAARFEKPAAREAMFDRVMTELATLPGVRSVSTSSDLPMTETRFGVRLRQGLNGKAMDEIVYVRAVSLNYLASMDMRLTAGRPFIRADHGAAPPGDRE